MSVRDSASVASAADTVDAAEDVEPVSSIRIKRRLNVNISGTMQNFHAAGTHAAEWKPMQGKHTDVFGLNETEGATMDAGMMTNCLRNAIIRKVTVLETKSTFPVPLGVTINCIPSEEVTDSGERFAMTTLANSQSSTPLVIYETDPTCTDGIEWRNRYPNYNASNLETFGVMDVPRYPFVFLHKDHPAVDLMRVNSSLLGGNIDDQDLIEDSWYKVTKQMMHAACNMLRTRVLSRVSTRDLSTFSLQLHRLDAVNWGDHTDNGDILSALPHMPNWTAQQQTDAESKFLDAALRKNCSYTARIELEYEIQPNA